MTGRIVPEIQRSVISMTRLPVTSMPRAKLGYLTQAMCSPQMYLSLEGNRYDSTQKATVYEIEIGVLSGADVSVHRKFMRFSSLEKLNASIQPFLRGCKRDIQFPPKRYFGNLSQAFVSERSNQLQQYLLELTRIPDISEQFAFVSFFDLGFGHLK
jgi:hypothetical protein